MALASIRNDSFEKHAQRCVELAHTHFDPTRRLGEPAKNVHPHDRKHIGRRNDNIDTRPQFSILTSTRNRLIWLGLRAQLGSANMRRSAFARLVSPPTLVTSSLIQATISELESTFGRSLAEPPAIASVQLRALRAYDERERLGELASIPCLVQSAAHDPIAEPTFGRELSARIGTARLKEFPDASHALPIQDRREVNARLLAHFLESERNAL